MFDNDYKQEWIEERAAILEFEAGYNEYDAEFIAEQMYSEFVKSMGAYEQHKS